LEHVQISVFKAGLEAATLDWYDHLRRLRKNSTRIVDILSYRIFILSGSPLVASPTIKVFHAYRRASCALHRYMKCSKLESQQYHLFRPQNTMWSWPYQLYAHFAHSKNQTVVLANILVTVVACSCVTILPMLIPRMQYSKYLMGCW